MQDTYSDCITTTNQCYGYFLTSQDYLDWGRDFRNQSERDTSRAMDVGAKDAAKNAQRGSKYPRKFVPYVSRAGYVGLWKASKCLDHKTHDSDDAYDTQPIVRDVVTPKKELPVPVPPPIRSSRLAVSGSQRVRKREEKRELVREKTIRLPDIKIHPLANREESGRRRMTSLLSPNTVRESTHAAPFKTQYQNPWRNTAMVRGV